MGFWIFMTVMNLVLPFVMIVIGYIFIKNPPKEINHLAGYRTTVGEIGSVVIGVQTVILLASLIPTEIALRKNFDKDGNRIKI